jgi:hypothetical protein
MSWSHIRFFTFLTLTLVPVSGWSVPSATAQVQEAASPLIQVQTESATDTVIAHPDGALETRTVDPKAMGQGSWIRFRTRSDPTHEREGRVGYAANGVLLVIEKEGSVPSNLSLDELENLKLRGPGMGKSGGAQVGITLGAISGLIIGGGVGHRNEPDCAPNSWFCYKGLATIGGALLGSAIGAVAGALVGFVVTPGGWVDVPLPSIEVRTESTSIAVRVPVR